MTTGSDLPSELRSTGLRVTAQRLSVLDVLRSGRVHLTTEQVVSEVASRLQSVSVQAVYDALAALCAAGLVRRIEPAGSPALFEARVADNHHHVVCRYCHAVADVDCATGTAPCLEPSSTSGYSIDEAEVTFWGICPRCQASAR